MWPATHTTFLFAFPSTASFVSQKQLPFSEHFKKKILSFSPMEENDYFLRDVLQGALVQWPMGAVSVCLKRFRLLAVMTSKKQQSCCWYTVVVGVGVFLWCVVLIFVLHFQHDFQFASVINKWLVFYRRFSVLLSHNVGLILVVEYARKWTK